MTTTPRGQSPAALARKTVAEFIATTEEPALSARNALPEDVLAAIRVLAPVRVRPAKKQKTSVLNALARFFPEVGATVELFELFKIFRFGESEMRVRTRQLVQDLPADDRLWIAYNPDTAIYTLLHKGQYAPEGWNGPLPRPVQGTLGED